jgi:hypothetical protein
MELKYETGNLEGDKARASQLTQQPPQAPQPTAIPIDSIQPQNPVDVSSALPKPDTASANALVAGTQVASKGMQDYLSKIQEPQTQLNTQNEALVNRLGELYGSQVGKTQATREAEKAAGVDAVNKQLTELNSQAQIRLAQYDKMFANEELVTGRPSSLVVGRQAALRRSEAADISLMQARASALQGQYDIAKDTAARAIDIKYGNTIDEIVAKEKQLELIKPMLTKEQEKVAKVQEMVLADEKQKAEEAKEKSKSNIDLAFTTNTTSKFANKGGEVFRVSDGKPYDNVEEFLKDAGVSSFDEAYQKGLIKDISTQLIEDRNFVMKAREAYPDAGIDFNDSVDTAAQKIRENSYIFGKETYMDFPGSDSSSGGDTGSIPESIKIGDQTYFMGDDGQLYPASSFVAGSNGMTGVNGTPGITPMSGEEIQRAEQTKALADKLMGHGGLKGAVGAKGPSSLFGLKGMFGIGSKQPFAGTDAANFVTELEQFKSLLTLDNLKFLKGPTSDKDIAFIMSASAGLSTDMSESEFKAKVKEIRDRIEQNLAAQSSGSVQSPAGLDSSILNSKGLSFNQVGNTSASYQVKGSTQKVEKLPLLDPTGKQVAKVPAGTTKSLTSYVASKYPSGSKGGQCGTWVRKVVNSTGLNYPTLGDGLNSKIAAVQKHGSPIGTAKPGSVLVTRENPTYGHVAYIIGKNEKGFIVAESNFKQDERVSYGRIIPYNSPKIVGVINPTKA